MERWTAQVPRRGRRSLRLTGYAYTGTGAYFVTICTQDKECLFGQIVGGKMRPNVYGHVVKACWFAIPRHSRNAACDAFVVMPNHMHGVIVLAGVNAVGAQHVAPLRKGGGQSGSLGAIVRSFKGAVSKRINRRRGTPGAPVWQRNYYEHVIRSEDELQQIRRYIEENPLRWSLDREHPER